MCMCLGGSRGACVRGGNKDYCPASMLSAGNCGCGLTASRWNVERPKQEPKLPFFIPSLFVGGEKISLSSCSAVAGFWLFVSAGGGAEGRQAGSVNAYHDHNRAKEHSSAMKAQRERLRIPGLTLEWVFSSVTLRVAAPLQRVASLTSLSYLWLSFTVAISSVQR